MANPSWALFFFLLFTTTTTISFSSASRSLMVAPSPSPAAPDCASVIYDMIDCLDYVSDGSNLTEPTPSCCTAVGSVVDVSPLCLCDGLEEAANLGFAINVTRAVPLPGLCSIQIPSDKLCPASKVEPQVPSASPSQSPSYSLAPENYTPPPSPSLTPSLALTPSPAFGTPSPAFGTPSPALAPSFPPSPALAPSFPPSGATDEPIPESAASSLVSSMGIVAVLVAASSCL